MTPITIHSLRKHRQERTLAGPDALDPGMIKVCFADITALLKPSAAASATAGFSRFLHDAALGTYDAKRGWF